PDGTLLLFQAVMKIHAERPLFRQALDQPDVAGRNRRSIAFVIPFRERVTIAIEQVARFVRGLDESQRLVEAIAPGADDRCKLTFERRSLYVGCCPPVSTAHEIHADPDPGTTDGRGKRVR